MSSRSPRLGKAPSTVLGAGVRVQTSCSPWWSSLYGQSQDRWSWHQANPQACYCSSRVAALPFHRYVCVCLCVCRLFVSLSLPPHIRCVCVFVFVSLYLCSRRHTSTHQWACQPCCFYSGCQQCWIGSVLSVCRTSHVG